LRGLHPGHQLPFPEKPPGIKGFVWMCHFRRPNALPNANIPSSQLFTAFSGPRRKPRFVDLMHCRDDEEPESWPLISLASEDALGREQN